MQGAEGVEGGAAEDGEVVVLGRDGVRGPAGAGVDDDSLGRVGGVVVGYAAAVGEEGRLEGDGGVELLADEKVAVVEGCGCHSHGDLIGPGSGGGDFDCCEGVVHRSGFSGFPVGGRDDDGFGHG